MNDVITDELLKKVCQIRKEIHACPETGNHEYYTADLIERVLKENGIETKRYLDTAVVGILHLGKGIACRYRCIAGRRKNRMCICFKE